MKRYVARQRLPTETQVGSVLRIDYHLTAKEPIFVGSTSYESPAPLAVDVHEGFEVGILLSGSQERHFQDFTHMVEPGDVWLCGTWEPHGWRVPSAGTLDVVAIFLAGHLGNERFGNVSWLSLFSVHPSQRPRVNDAETRGRMLALGHDLLAEMQDARTGWESAVRLNLLQALFTMSRNWSVPSAAGPGYDARPTDLARIMPALRLVHSSPARRVNLAEAAAACNLSRGRFCAVFKNTVGLTFGEFCLRARLALAAGQLLDRDASTEAIAEQTGFSDASHFHHSFLKRYGCTPASYRKQGRMVETGTTFGVSPGS